MFPPPPPPQAGSWLLWGEASGERAEEAHLSPGALGEGFKVLHQDMDIFVSLSLQYLKHGPCAWISKQPCESLPRPLVTWFLAARNLCIFIALRSAGTQATGGWCHGRGLVQRAAVRLPPACVLPAGLVLHESAPDPWSTLQEFCVIPPPHLRYIV